MKEGVYMVAIVIHEQSDGIADALSLYESRLKSTGLPDVPFHCVDLLHGHGDYESCSVEVRNRLLLRFAYLAYKLPVRYQMLSYDNAYVHGREDLEAALRRDLASFFFDNLGFFQGFDEICIYYDGGHEALDAAVHQAATYALARDACTFKAPGYSEKRLLQFADYVCGIERAAIAYGRGSQTKTQERFFGDKRRFSQSFAKQLRRKRF